MVPEPPGGDDKGFKVVDRRGEGRDEAAPAEPTQPAEERAPRGASIPEVDFATFIISLGSSALIHLGDLAPPGESAPRSNLPLAKQTIDILGMLADKTRGNLTTDEHNLLEHLLYDLRMKYVEAKKRR